MGAHCATQLLRGAVRGILRQDSQTKDVPAAPYTASYSFLTSSVRV